MGQAVRLAVAVALAVSATAVPAQEREWYPVTWTVTSAASPSSWSGSVLEDPAREQIVLEPISPGIEWGYVLKRDGSTYTGPGNSQAWVRPDGTIQWRIDSQTVVVGRRKGAVD